MLCQKVPIWVKVKRKVIQSISAGIRNLMKLGVPSSLAKMTNEYVKAYPEFIVSHFVTPVEVLVLILSITSIPRSTKKKVNQKNKALHAYDSPVHPVSDLLQEFVTTI